MLTGFLLMPELFEFAFERFPPEAIFASRFFLFDAQGQGYAVGVTVEGGLNGWATGGEFAGYGGKSGHCFDEEFGCAKIPKQKIDIFRRGSGSLGEIEAFNKAC